MKPTTYDIFKSANDAICIIDLGGVIIDCNESAEKLYGYNNYHLTGKSFSLLLPKERRSELDNIINNIQAAKSIEPFESERITSEKKIIKVSSVFSPIRNETGKIVCISCIERKLVKMESVANKAHELLETAPDAMIIVNAKGKIIFANKQTETLFGFTKEELLDNEIETLFPSRFASYHEKLIRSYIDHPDTRSLNYRVDLLGKRKDGTEIPVEISLSPVTTTEGAFISAAIRDVTDRKQSEQKVEALLQRINLITRAVKLGIFERDLTTGEMTCDENFYKIYELNPSQPFTIDAFTNALHPQDRDRVLANINNAVKNKLPELNQEFRIFTPGGEEKYILNKTLFISDENGNIIKTIGSNWDITDLQRTREALQESGRKMNALLQSTREGIYLYDTNLRLILMNEQGEKFAEMRSGEKAKIGQHVSEFTREDEIESVEKILQRVLEGHACDIERNIPSKDGSLWLHLTYNPVKENNEIIGVCIVARDVTELVHSRENLVAARQRAEQSERLQEQFLANMSHEIRTPLNGIVGMSNLLLNTPLNDQQKEFLHSILHSSDSLLFLINDILDLSKIKAGKFRLEKIPMDVFDVIEELAAPFKIKAQEKGIRLSVMMDPFIPRVVLGDPHRLGQVLNNLLSNAIKFTDTGFTKLEVELAEKVGGNIVLDFIVSDTGIGIDEQLLEHVFESFAQEGTDTARKFGGTGLGLAITKRLAELQGGSISVTSTKGKGSRFVVSIPYEMANEKDVKKKEISASLPDTNEKPDFTGKRVLVAEDNDVNQQVIRHLLNDYGIEATLVADGKQAIETLEADPSFDLILLDLRMPVMDGFQALAWIRQKLKLSVPIIVLTASVLRDERDRCLEIGANDYQAKPFSRPVLLQCLKKFLV
jgi:PAS domain S-box-containing protein